MPNSPATPKLGLTGPMVSQCSFEPVQLLGVQALAQILGCQTVEKNTPNVTFAIGKHIYITSACNIFVLYFITNQQFSYN